jgi:hypothetical protein
VDKMLASIPWWKFQEWVAYAQLEPFDEARSDIRTAQITAAVVNMNRDTTKHPRPLPIKDFVLKFGEAEIEQTWQEQLRISRMISAAYTEEAKVP